MDAHVRLITSFLILPDLVVTIIVVIIELVILEQLYLAVTLFVFVQQCLHICICNTLIVTVYEFAGVPLAA